MSNERPTLADQLSGNLPILSSTARTAFIASHFIFAMGSGAVIMYFIVSKLSGTLAPWMCYVLAWLGSLVWYKAVENPLRKFILFAWAYRLAQKDEAAKLSENMKRTGKASWHVTLLLLAATLSLSFFVNFDIAEAVTVEQDSTAEIEHANKLTGSYDRDVEILREQVAAAPEADRRAIAQAKKDAARWERAAQDVRGKNLGDLIRAGNGWAYKQLSRKQRAHLKAEIKRGEDHVANAATLPRLQAELNEYIRTHSVGRDTVQAMTASILTSRSEAYKGTLSRRYLMLFVALLIVAFVFVYTARLLVLACLETGEDLEDDPGEGVGKVAARLIGKANAKLGAKISEKWGDKLAVAPAGLSQRQKSAHRPISQQTRLGRNPGAAKSQNVKPAENSLTDGFQGENSERKPNDSAGGIEKSAPYAEKSAPKVSAPPPAGLAVPAKVSAAFWVDDETIKFRKRVYGWWSTAHNKKRPIETREDNREKAEKAFAWFEAQRCKITKKPGGKVSIKFPKG